MSKLPVWARKPNHKKTVIATDRGWTVEETGEVLRLVSELPAKLKELHGEVDELASVIETSRSTIAPVISETDGIVTDSSGIPDVPVTTDDEPVQEEKVKPAKEVKTDEVTEKKKPGPKPGARRGPKKKTD